MMKKLINITDRANDIQKKIALRNKFNVIEIQMSKDYTYRSTWEHKYSRSINKARRGNLTKEKMLEKYGRFPMKKEWFLEGITEKEWIEEYIKNNPKNF